MRFLFSSRSALRAALALSLVLLVIVTGYLLIERFPRLALWRAPALSSIAECLQPHDEASTNACLRSTVASLLQSNTTQQLQDYVVASTTPKNVVLACHGINHIIGEETLKKDNGNLEEALSQCSASCRGGCIHGAVGAAVLSQLGEPYSEDDIAHSGNNEIERLGSRYCTQSDVLCHALGHLLYMVNQGDSNGLDICAKIGSGYAAEACYQGFFMERAGETSGSWEQLDAFSQSKTQSTRAGFSCQEFAEPYRHACYQFYPEYFSSLPAEVNATSSSEKLNIVSSACANLPATDRAYCFEGLGLQIGTLELGDKGEICGSLSTSADRMACTLGAIPTNFFANYPYRRVTTYCASITDTAQRGVCFDAEFEWFVTNKANDASKLPSAACAGSAVCNAAYQSYVSREASLPDYRFGLFGKLPRE